MKRSHTASFVIRWSLPASIFIGVTLAFLFLSEEASARVGGGQSYGGGSGSGGGGGDGAAGAIIWLIFQVFRFLIYLTIEYPVVGIPLDILVVCGVAAYFVRRARRVEPATPLGLDTNQGHSENIPRQFEQLRKFDPNSLKLFLPTLPMRFTEKRMMLEAMAPPRLISFRPISARSPASTCSSGTHPDFEKLKG